MELVEQDRVAIHDLWMSQKAKMRMTQMAMAKRLGLTQVEFSDLIRGSAPLTMPFVSQFCRLLKVEPQHYLPSLKQTGVHMPSMVRLQNRVVIDGQIEHVYIEGNQVIIEYVHAVQH
ncbi:hypothetical protein BCU68_03205 [Vibrio sp. 10N.286.49.B3]|uniref:helix-turn-helix domain-containing protein n=1 Tax=Vibrio sp. 10N.286.49.B3 TaxID=1880855 RepID=UPI000C81EF45|nr:helix-turn-helix transcriptional regulator [Vibrio sp. 10N.286.49.B3]PMH44522.1 hypothetical protein BCU68_03205 [Vibrio sp. 10N.286.49.B3]